jgi:hypothetical protein
MIHISIYREASSADIALCALVAARAPPAREGSLSLAAIIGPSTVRGSIRQQGRVMASMDYYSLHDYGGDNCPTSHGHLDMVRDLLHAAARGDLAGVAAALARGAEIIDAVGRVDDHPGSSMGTALSLAVDRGHVQVVEFLLRAGASTTAGLEGYWQPPCMLSMVR